MEKEIQTLLDEMRKKKINPQLVVSISNTILRYVKPEKINVDIDRPKKIAINKTQAKEIDRYNSEKYPINQHWNDKIVYVLKILKFATATDIRIMITAFEPKIDPYLLHKNIQVELSEKYLKFPPESDKQVFFRKKILKQKEFLYCLSYNKHKDFWNSFGINHESKVFESEDFRVSAGF